MNYQQTSCDSCGNTDCQSRKPGHFKETPEQVRKRKWGEPDEHGVIEHVEGDDGST